jgi:site-specific DNA recombinase
MGPQKNRDHQAYICLSGFHVSRKVEPVEQFVTAVVLERLARQDAVALLTPADLDAGTARALDEAREKRARLEGFYDAAASGELTPAALARIEARLLPEIATAEKRARRSVGSPLVESLVGPHPKDEWETLTVEQQREVVGTLLSVKILPWGRGRRIFDPESVEITWRTP